MAQQQEVSGASSSELRKVSQAFNDLVLPANRNNLSPVFQRPIDQHNGITITGEFMTTDETTEGRMSYITTRRNQDVAIPFDGYGIGWKIGDGTKYNVYIVDNDSLQSDVFINEEQMWDQTGGTNQFLAAASMEILKDVWYSFTITIYAKLGMDVWIFRTDSVPAELNAGNRTIYRGQTYPAYVPQSAGDHFGISVLETQNYEWNYKTLKIVSIIDTYPMNLFKIKTPQDKFLPGEGFTLTYYGLGYGDTENAVKFYARNQNTQAWDLCGENTEAPGSVVSDLKLVKSLSNIDDYRDGDDFVNVLATPYNYLDDEHVLQSYYVAATNTLLSGIHRGNMTDIYVDDKSKITIDTQSVVMGSQELVFSTTAMTFPIVDIIAVSRTLSGALYEENVDYSVTRPTEATAFSTRDDIKIVFSDPGVVGISIDFMYRYYSDGEAIQTLLESPEYRYPGADNLGKIKPMSIVQMTGFDYRGPVAKETVQDALIAHINTISDGSLEVTDLVNAAYSVGATYVDLSSIVITIKDQNYLGTYTNATFADPYTITGDLKTYFADATSLLGVRRID